MPKARRELKETPDFLGNLENLGHQENLDVLGDLGKLGHLENLDYLGSLDLKELKETVELYPLLNLVSIVKYCKVNFELSIRFYYRFRFRMHLVLRIFQLIGL